MIKRLFALLLLLIPCMSQGATYYVCDTATCGQTPSAPYGSWSVAADELSTVTAVAARGDTIYIADGAYSTVTFDTANSGSTIITVKKCPSSALATESTCQGAAGWNNTYGDGQAVFPQLKFKSGWWTIDGTVGGGPGSWGTGHGIKVSDGDAASTVEFIQIGKLTGSTAQNITLKHIEIGNSVMPHPGCDTGIYAAAGYTRPDNITLQYCYIHHMGEAALTTTKNYGWLFEYNYFSMLGNGGACDGTCCTSSGGSHGTGFQFDDTDSMTLRYNLFEDISGSGWIGYYGSVGTGAEFNNVNIYGNIFRSTANQVWTVTFKDATDTVEHVSYYPVLSNPLDEDVGKVAFQTITTTTGISPNTDYYVINRTATTFQLSLTPGGSPINLVNDGTGTKYRPISNGIIYNTSGAAENINNLKIYNNTFYNIGYSITPNSTILGISNDTSGNEFKNNIVYNSTGTPVYTGTTKDNNASDDAITGDSHLVTLTSDPFTDSANGDFSLKAGTNQCVDAGATLASPYDVDILGYHRPNSGGSFDIGAYERGGNTTPTDPTDPTFASFTTTFSVATHGYGEADSICLNWDRNVATTGTALTLTLSNGKVLTLPAITNAPQACATYIIGLGETTTDLHVDAIGSTGATVTDYQDTPQTQTDFSIPVTNLTAGINIDVTKVVVIGVPGVPSCMAIIGGNATTAAIIGAP